MDTVVLNSLEQILDRRPAILVVGDIMIDHFIYGRVNRISPEAPVPIVQCFKELNTLGGCGNVVRNLSNLMVNTTLVSAIGEDTNGEIIQSKLVDLDVPISGLLLSPHIHTTHKMRVIAEKQQVVRVDWDANSLMDEEYRSLGKLLSAGIQKTDGILISDYNKGLCTNELIQSAIQCANNLGIPIFIDPKGQDWSKYRGATLITPNAKEAEELIGYNLLTNKNFEETGRKICKDYNINACLITRGKDGMSYIGDEQVYHVSSRAREVYDVSGAGDTVIACIAAALIAGVNIESALHFANTAAGIVVGRIGTEAIKIEELKDLC